MGATYSSCTPSRTSSILFFFFNDTATTEIYTLSLHDALPISLLAVAQALPRSPAEFAPVPQLPATLARRHGPALLERSEEHTSELQSRSDLVCRLLLEKKKETHTTETHTATRQLSVYARYGPS